jgi:hypothetical protein
MDPLLILIPGLFGGLLLALLIAATRRGTSPTFVPRRLAAPSPSLINMAHIRVEGVGGLGMVGAIVIVAVTDSRIRLATIVALLLGGGLALVLITMRRRTGSLPSAGPDSEDRSVLHLEGERRRPQAGGRDTGALAELSAWLDRALRPSWLRAPCLTPQGGVLAIHNE